VIFYKLNAYKRGLLPGRPIQTKFGDTLGLADVQELERQPDFITVIRISLLLRMPIYLPVRR